MNGVEKLWYAQNAQGHLYLTAAHSPLRRGYQRFSTAVPAEMDRIFEKLNAQTRAEHAALTQADYQRRIERIAQWRSDIRGRMASSECSNFEREVLRVALKSCDEREAKLNRNTVYGVSAMQQAAAPIPARTEVEVKARVEHDGYVDLRSVKTATEAIQ